MFYFVKIIKSYWRNESVMILYQNYEILVSVLIYLIVKILCEVVNKNRVSMHNKHPTLTSIPEKNETEDDVIKWVPKKKHDVLKAKYKCLKKLFQIYDASVIGILPEPYTQNPHQPDELRYRRKRSRRTKADACACTTDICGDVPESKKSVATAVIKDLNIDNISSSQIDKSKTTIFQIKDDKSTQDSKENLSVVSEKESEYQQPHPVPYLVINEKRKLTRFQSFIQRILGIRKERNFTYIMSHDRPYAASDDNIANKYEKRQRRGLRFRRLGRTKKTHSEIALRDVNSPVILSYVHSVQRNCLMDTTPRQCPISGCKMLSYGIINYNDHLNLCHFTNRTHICVYCHEGFTKEHDKIIHENEHLGITKLNTKFLTVPSTTRFSNKIASNTQTDPDITKIDVPEEKLKKIVSFFDKISDPDQIVAEIKKNRCSESNLQILHQNQNTETESELSKTMCSSENSDAEKITFSSMNLQKIPNSNQALILDSEKTSKYPCVPPVRCQLCGDVFDYRKQLSLHVDVRHRAHEKFSKYHSCAGIFNRGHEEIIQKSTQSLSRSLASTALSEVSRRKSEESLSYEPSTNIVYYTSMESINKKPSTVNNLVQKVRSSFCYKWEPATKIIRI